MFAPAREIIRSQPDSTFGQFQWEIFFSIALLIVTDPECPPVIKIVGGFPMSFFVFTCKISGSTGFPVRITFFSGKYFRLDSLEIAIFVEKKEEYIFALPAAAV